MQQDCRLSTPFESGRFRCLRGCRLNTPFVGFWLDILYAGQVVCAAVWRWPVGVGHISSLCPSLGRLGHVERWHEVGRGLGVCGGVPFGVPLALFPFPLARDKYIAPLNLQKASSREVNR